MNDNMMKNFEERMEAKKAAKPKLHRFEAEFKIGVDAQSEDVANETIGLITALINRYDDLQVIEAKLK